MNFKHIYKPIPLHEYFNKIKGIAVKIFRGLKYFQEQKVGSSWGTYKDSKKKKKNILMKWVT